MTPWIALLLAGVAVVAVGAGVGLWRIGRPPARLEIGDRGIRGPLLDRGFIPWEEIEGAYPPTSAESQTLGLRLRVTRRLAGGQRSLVVPVDLAGSDLSAVDVLQEILAHQEPSPPG